MKLLLITLGSILLSFNHSSYAQLDPDHLDPSMPVVSYLISADNIKIASYRQGSPSHLSVILCNNCKEKTYALAPTATLESFNQPLKQSELTIKLLKKEFEKVRLGVDRAKGEIIYLRLGASVDDELSPQQQEQQNLPRVKKL